VNLEYNFVNSKQVTVNSKQRFAQTCTMYRQVTLQDLLCERTDTHEHSVKILAKNWIKSKLD